MKKQSHRVQNMHPVKLKNSKTSLWWRSGCHYQRLDKVSWDESRKDVFEEAENSQGHNEKKNVSDFSEPKLTLTQYQEVAFWRNLQFLEF